MVKLSPGRLVPWPLIFVLYTWAAPDLSANCKAPHYRVGKTYPPITNSVVLDISIRPEEFTREELICLASVLKEKYPAPEIAVGIFSSQKAALNYTLRAEHLPNQELWASMQHAQFYYSAEKHEEYLLLMPDGLSVDPNSPFNTRIDLPATVRPSCKLQIRDRCLLAFDHIDATTEGGSGTVTLIAQVEQNGSVSGVRIADRKTITSSQQQSLVDFAVRNLKSWRFERSKAKDAIRVTFSLERIDTPLEHGVNMEFILPDRVNIKMGPQLVRH